MVAFSFLISKDHFTGFSIWTNSLVSRDGSEGEPNDADREIIHSLQRYPCAQEVLAKLPNLKNKVSEWLMDVFKNNKEFNITFSVDDELAGTSTDGYHTSFGNMNKQT